MSNPFMTSSWSVRFELPADKAKGRDWSHSLSATVICDTAERASEIIREAHADAVVYAINHKGKDVTYADPLALSRMHIVKAGDRCDKNRSYSRRHEPNDHGRCVHCAGLVEPPETPCASVERGDG